MGLYINPAPIVDAHHTELFNPSPHDRDFVTTHKYQIPRFNRAKDALFVGKAIAGVYGGWFDITVYFTSEANWWVHYIERNRLSMGTRYGRGPSDCVIRKPLGFLARWKMENALFAGAREEISTVQLCLSNGNVASSIRMHEPFRFILKPADREKPEAAILLKHYQSLAYRLADAFDEAERRSL